MTSDKPFSAACERNREPILTVLRSYLADRHTVLEVGSGTGQHAVYFAAALPHLSWQTSDRAVNHAGIRQWLAEAALPNLPPPLTLDVAGPWPAQTYDVLFTANTLHIMGWGEVQQFFAALPAVMTPDALLIIYGPFNIGGAFSSESNAAFDAGLRSHDPSMGLRDIEAVTVLATQTGLHLVQNHAMPANNRLLVWQRRAGERSLPASGAGRY